MTLMANQNFYINIFNDFTDKNIWSQASFKDLYKYRFSGMIIEIIPVFGLKTANYKFKPDLNNSPIIHFQSFYKIHHSFCRENRSTKETWNCSVQMSNFRMKQNRFTYTSNFYGSIMSVVNILFLLFGYLPYMVKAQLRPIYPSEFQQPQLQPSRSTSVGRTATSCPIAPIGCTLNCPHGFAWGVPGGPCLCICQLDPCFVSLLGLQLYNDDVDCFYL